MSFFRAQGVQHFPVGIHHAVGDGQSLSLIHIYFPLLRLDRVFCTPPLKPERAATVLIPDTVRRSILADIAMH